MILECYCKFLMFHQEWQILGKKGVIRKIFSAQYLSIPMHSKGLKKGTQYVKLKVFKVKVVLFFQFDQRCVRHSPWKSNSAGRTTVPCYDYELILNENVGSKSPNCS